jgi:hypothetical protein
MHNSPSRIAADYAALYSNVLEHNAADQFVSALAQ